MIRDSERAVSSAVTYTMVVLITVTLTGGLVIGADALISNQREQASQDQLIVVGERLAGSITTVDQLAATESGPAELTVTRDLPDRVAGEQYRVRIVQSPSSAQTATIYVHARDIGVNESTAVTVSTADEIEETTINGGPLQVTYTAGDNVRVERA